MTAMTDRTPTDAELRAALAAVTVECVHYDQSERPMRRWRMPLAGLLAPVDGRIEGRVSPALRTGLRDAS